MNTCEKKLPFLIIEKIIQRWKHHQSHTGGHVHKNPVTTMTFEKFRRNITQIHNFIDGLIIGASYFISITWWNCGWSTFAVILHEIPQEIGNFGVLVHGGYTRSKAIWFNFLSAMTAVIGTVTVIIIGSANDEIIMALIICSRKLHLYSCI
ncbi:ZIP family metal transporter [Candidatus Roizmanbacteria bacterium]|nr:MAG: ZIP family metal transporter [Candidatus Roizmanbacteria bacterium]